MPTNTPTRILKSLESQISAQQKEGGNFTHKGRNINVNAVRVRKDRLQSGIGYAQVDDGNINDKKRKAKVFFDSSLVPVDEADVAIILPDGTFGQTGKYMVQGNNIWFLSKHLMVILKKCIIDEKDFCFY